MSNPGDVTAVVVDDVIDGRPLVVDLDHDGVSCGLQHNPVHAIQRRMVWRVSLNHTHTGLRCMHSQRHASAPAKQERSTAYPVHGSAAGSAYRALTLPYSALYADFSLSQKCAQSDGKVIEK